MIVSVGLDLAVSQIMNIFSVCLLIVKRAEVSYRAVIARTSLSRHTVCKPPQTIFLVRCEFVRCLRAPGSLLDKEGWPCLLFNRL